MSYLEAPLTGAHAKSRPADPVLGEVGGEAGDAVETAGVDRCPVRESVMPAPAATATAAMRRAVAVTTRRRVKRLLSPPTSAAPVELTSRTSASACESLRASRSLSDESTSTSSGLMGSSATATGAAPTTLERWRYTKKATSAAKPSFTRIGTRADVALAEPPYTRLSG
jgi:hypothetical protein